jgi:peptide/nickel transport system substrate-binding protein
MRGGLRPRTKLVVLAVAVVLLALPTYGRVASSAVPSGKVVVALAVDARSMNPIEDNVGPVQNIYYAIFDSLVYIGADMKVQPGLAVSWKNIDANTWEFKLRQGVKFHNGEDFTAEDVKFTFDWMTSPEQAQTAAWAYYVKDVYGSSEVLDNHTIRFVMKKLDPLFLNRLTIYHMLPKDTFTRVGAPNFRLNPVGTGPFRFVEWVKDDHVSVEANPAYWGGAPNIKTVVFKIVPDPATRIAALQTGEVDLVYDVPPERAAELRRDARVRIEAVPGLRIIFFAFNTRKPPLDDVRVRQALNYAVDKRGVITRILLGYGVQRAATTSPSIAGYVPDLKPYPYDPEKAKQLLREAGHPNGFEFTLAAPRGRYLKDAEIAEAVAGQLARVGVTANLFIRPWPTFWERYLSPAKKELGDGAFFAGFGNPALDADLTYDVLHRCGSYNGYYCSPQVDRLIAQEQRIVTNPAARIKVLQQIERKLYDDAAWLFLGNYLNVYAMNARLVWKPMPDESIRLNRAVLRP